MHPYVLLEKALGVPWQFLTHRRPNRFLRCIEILKVAVSYEVMKVSCY